MCYTHTHTADLLYLSHQIPCSRMFKKLMVAQLVKKLAATLEAPTFIVLLRIDGVCSLS